MNWTEALELAEMAIADREGTGLLLVDRVANAILAASDSSAGLRPIRVMGDSRLRDDEWELRTAPALVGRARRLRGRR